jgi:hypothetical protein
MSTITIIKASKNHLKSKKLHLEAIEKEGIASENIKIRNRKHEQIK